VQKIYMKRFFGNLRISCHIRRGFCQKNHEYLWCCRSKNCTNITTSYTFLMKDIFHFCFQGPLGTGKAEMRSIQFLVSSIYRHSYYLCVFPKMIMFLAFIICLRLWRRAHKTGGWSLEPAAARKWAYYSYLELKCHSRRRWNSSAPLQN